MATASERTVSTGGTKLYTGGGLCWQEKKYELVLFGYRLYGPKNLIKNFSIFVHSTNSEIQC